MGPGPGWRQARPCRQPVASGAMGVSSRGRSSPVDTLLRGLRRVSDLFLRVHGGQLLLHLKGIFKENRPEHELGPIEPS